MEPQVSYRFGNVIPRHIMKYFPYSQIKQLFLINWEFNNCKDESFYNELLHQQFGLARNKKGDFKQYYIMLQNIIKKAKQMSIAIGRLSQFSQSKLQMDLYKSIKKEQIKYENVDIDIRFLMIKSLSNLSQTRYVFGGISYYNMRQFYITSKDEEIFIENNNILYPEIMIQYNVVLADFQNKIGQGKGQRYILFQFDEINFTLIKWNENCLKNTIYNPSLKYYDFFDTLLHPKSDCTTRGIRIRTDARLVTNDPRFTLNQPFFSYQIRFSDNGATKKGAKLKTRKWIIKSYSEVGQEIIQQFQGQGVIGQYPYIYEACEDFVYESCVKVQGIKGVMLGHFLFQDNQSKQNFEVIVQPFPLEFGPNAVYQYNHQTNEVKLLI